MAFYLYKDICSFLPDTISANSWGVLSNPLPTTGIVGIAGTWQEGKEKNNQHSILKFI